MLLAVLVGFIFAPIAPLLFQILRDRLGWVVPLVPLGLFIYFASQFQAVSEGTVYIANYEWVPELGVNLNFRLDSLSMIFALLITGIGTLVFTYAGGYLHGNANLGKFYAYLLMFMASMLGVVLANNLMLIFVFWELTSISSYLLISFYSHRAISREAGRTALTVTGAGGLSLLAGLILLGIVADTNVISDIVPLHEEVVHHDLYLPVLILVAIGAFAKSAQFPFHFWLPGAMEAPAPVSAYLHSATMVKAGIYLLARMNPILGHTDEWLYLITIVGGITMLLGGYLSWQQTDVKKILAYTTISALGIIVFTLGLSSGTATKAAILFLIIHSLYKGAFFMVGGIIDHETGTRDINQLGGLYRLMPFTAIGAALAGLSMAGVPPMLGFWGKEVIYEATDHAEDLSPLILTAVAIIGNLFNVTAAAIVAIRPFYGEEKHTPKHAHEAPFTMWLGPIVLGIVSFLLGFLPFGILPDDILEMLLKEPVATVYGSEYDVHLEFHLNFLFFLSVITIIGGLILFFLVDRLRPVVAPFQKAMENFSPTAGYKAFINGTLKLANMQGELLKRSYLRYYITVVLIFFVTLIGLVLVREADTIAEFNVDDVRVHEAMIALGMVVAALIATQTQSRLAAVASLGIVGLGVTTFYILFSAPDLAMTQVAIETLTVILFVLILYRLPRFEQHSTNRARLRDAIIASAFGATMTILILIILSAPLDSRITPFFAQRSYIEAHGANVVNVILVDFRGIDTMGEITVLSIAAIGVFALLKLDLENGDDDEENDDDE